MNYIKYQIYKTRDEIETYVNNMRRYLILFNVTILTEEEKADKEKLDKLFPISYNDNSPYYGC